VRSGVLHTTTGTGQLLGGRYAFPAVIVLTLAALLTDRPRTLVVLERGDNLTWLSLRNVDTVHLLAVDQLNTYDVLLSDDVVFTKAAYDAFVAGPATGKSVTAVATSTEAEEESK
jgi:large subunit ribosomal protein L4